MLINDLANALADLDRNFARTEMTYEDRARWVLRRMCDIDAPAPVEPAPATAPVDTKTTNDYLPTYANANRMAEPIPAGRYAIEEMVGEDVVIKFYKIDKPDEGRWAGKTFLKALASDDEHPIKLAARQMSVYAQIIKAGIEESSRRYGLEIGSCGVCGRTLTDPESIADGIGPVCKNKMGW